jgi:hypothetical protein
MENYYLISQNANYEWELFLGFFSQIIHTVLEVKYFFIGS